MMVLLWVNAVEKVAEFAFTRIPEKGIFVNIK